MKLQVLVDGEDKGTVELGGESLMPYANLISNFNELVGAIYDTENEGGEYWLQVDSNISLKFKRPKRQRKAMKGVRQ